jgi:hypothetical protein
MFPNNELSDVPVASQLLPPDNQRSSDLEDFEDGGVGIQNPSAGVSGHVWRCYMSDSDVMLQRVGLSPQLLFNQPGVRELAFAFDQNMRHNVAYRLADGRIYLRWFDSVASGYVVTDMGLGKNPRMALDDKRIAQSAASDVVLAYIRDGQVLYRLQRDRYGVEYVAAFGLASNLRLTNIGMGTNWRFHFILA